MSTGAKGQHRRWLVAVKSYGQRGMNKRAGHALIPVNQCRVNEQLNVSNSYRGELYKIYLARLCNNGNMRDMLVEFSSPFRHVRVQVSAAV